MIEKLRAYYIYEKVFYFFTSGVRFSLTVSRILTISVHVNGHTL